MHWLVCTQHQLQPHHPNHKLILSSTNIASIDALDPTSAIHVLNQSHHHQIPSSPPPPQSPPPQPHHHHHHELPIRILFLSNEIEDELRFGLNQISSNSVRNNLNYIQVSSTTTTSPFLDPNLKHINRQINQSRLRHELLKPRTIPNHLSQPSPSHFDISDLDSQTPVDLEFWWFVKLGDRHHDPSMLSFTLLLIMRLDGPDASHSLLLRSFRFQLDHTLADHEFKIRTSDSNFYQFGNTTSNYLLDTLLSISKDQSQTEHRFLITITYQRKCEAFRALGHLLGLTRHYSTHLSHRHPHPLVPRLDSLIIWNEEACQDIVGRIHNRHERCNFDTLGLMVDCSRNGVLKLDRVQELLRFNALMGLNMLQLYTEDTYEVWSFLSLRLDDWKSGLTFNLSSDVMGFEIRLKMNLSLDTLEVLILNKNSNSLTIMLIPCKHRPLFISFISSFLRSSLPTSTDPSQNSLSLSAHIPSLHLLAFDLTWGDFHNALDLLLSINPNLNFSLTLTPLSKTYTSNHNLLPCWFQAG